jgi:Uma2 family endonuclease
MPGRKTETLILLRYRAFDLGFSLIMTTKTEATIEDIYKVEGKAESLNGEIVHMSPTGDLPGSAAGEIYVSLREYARRTKTGRAYGDNIGFIIDLSSRRSKNGPCRLMTCSCSC